jgi:thioredoxin reductase (NADPH)
MHENADILIVGAGPLGIELHVALKRAGFRALHLESRQIGSTMAWWPYGTRWFSSSERIAIAGVPLITPGGEKATREEYLAYLRTIVELFDLPIQTYTRVTAIERTGGGFVVQARRGVGDPATGDEVTFAVPKIVLATGGTESPNLLDIPGENLAHVTHYFKDPHDYFRQNLLIVGGRNSAVEAALRCHRAGAKVTLSYRGDGLDVRSIKYWLWPEMQGLLKSGEIAGHFSTVPVEITRTHVMLQHLAPVAAAAPGNGAGTLEVPADFVLLMTGYRADMSLFAAAGVELQGAQQTPAHNLHTMETNVPGLFVAGTAVAGTQRGYKVFLENCHVHVERIVAAMQGEESHAETPRFERDEA